ncbi:MAG: sigma-54-dependent transcriptional regulator [Desulfovibrionaceae bacterium]
MSVAQTILIVDDEPDIARGLQRLVRSQYPEADVLVSADAAHALETLRTTQVALMITDLRMPGVDGMELLGQALTLEPDMSVVLHTAYGTIETAVQALKSGAYDFITKPVEPETLFRVVDKGLERNRLLGENQRLRSRVARHDLADVLIGESQPMRRLTEQLAAVAASDYTVLIRGESGTGKELAARAIHRQSNRAAKPLVSINCSAIPTELMESELFGHVKGAFTGADRHHKGLFPAAHQGTLLLDEIGDLPRDIQAKLLRVLQEREVRPVGSSQSVKVDVRVLASTNRDLEAMLRDGLFREDLFYRLNVLSVHLPPLHERQEDVPLLVRHFLNEACGQGAAREFAPDALAYLAARRWPGNVRELQNLVRKLLVFCTRDRIDLNLLRFVEGLGAPGADPTALSPYKQAKNKVVEAFTRTYAHTLLAQTHGNVSEAARISGLERVSLQKILKRFGIDAEEFRR